MVVLYSWSGVRDIPWSRVRVMVLAHCRVIVFGICRVIVCRWDDVTSFIISGCTIIVILYSMSGVRGIPWSRVRVRVVAHCRVMVLAFAGS